MSVKTVSEILAFTSADSKLKGFKVHEVAAPINSSLSYGRRDFYKIVLATGHKTIGYGDKTIEVNDTFLFFANPHVPHSVVHHSTEKKAMPVFLLRLSLPAGNAPKCCRIPRCFALAAYP